MATFFTRVETSISTNWHSLSEWTQKNPKTALQLTILCATVGWACIYSFGLWHIGAIVGAPVLAAGLFEGIIIIINFRGCKKRLLRQINNTALVKLMRGLIASQKTEDDSDDEKEAASVGTAGPRKARTEQD